MYYQRIEELTRNFYEWEQRGRGWDVWDFPVDLEPPFVPFYNHLPEVNTYTDDGRKPTFLSTLTDKFIASFTGRPQGNETAALIKIDQSQDLLPVSYSSSDEIFEIKITIPRGIQIKSEYIEQCLLNMTLSQFPVSYEIVGTKESIQLQISCREVDIQNIQYQIKAYFPESIITISESTLHTIINNTNKIVIVDFGLSQEFMCPLKTYESFNPDPLTGIFGVFEHLGSDEAAVVQVLFQSVQAPWSESIMRSVMNYDGTSFFADAPEMIKLAREKCKSPLFSVILRVVAQSKTSERTWEIAKLLSGCMSVYTDPQSNELIPLSNRDYENSAHFEDVLLRQSHRSGMILNSEELISFVHFPSPTIVTKKLIAQRNKSREAPNEVIGTNYTLGKNIHNGISKSISLTIEQRLRHMHIIGATGTGKSTLLLNLIMQDIQNGLGCAVFDPHGDLIESILEKIPENRHKDVIIFDPGDEEFPIGFNILEAKTEIEKNVVSSDLVEIFRRFSTSWGDQMSVVLGNAITAFLESKNPGTLIDLRKFLIEKDFRNEFLNTITDPHVKYFWEKEFPLLRGSALSSILTRLDFFLRPKIIRNIISQREGLDICEVLQKNKILLIKLSQGIIGEENAYLLGSLLVSKLHQIAMQRQIQKSEERSPFFVYLDEFQNFITPSMKAILSGARKYSLGLILAHQDLQQLWELDSALANSVISNAGTRVCFRLGDFDAQKLQNGFTHFNIEDLQNLSVGEAIVRVERSDSDFNIKTILFTQVNTVIAQENKDKIIELSRQKYGYREISKEVNSPINKIEGNTTQIRAEQKAVKPIIIPKIERERINKTDSDKKNLSQHRYIQTLIKRMAEQRGFKAVIEESTPDGIGRVDVGLERDGQKIACEISITTDGEHELKNIKKCFLSGFEKVLFCALEKKQLEIVRKMVMEKLSSEYYERVFYYLPDELYLFFEENLITDAKSGSEQIVKGYRVKVEYKTISDTKKKGKQEEVSGIIVNSLRRIQAIK